MEPDDKETLTRTYQSKADEALMELALSYDSLTETAQTALRDEFERRGLEPPELPDLPPETDLQRVVTMRQFRDLADAQLAKGVLESAGIPCFLRDENTVRMEWVWSNLLGGVRLQVREGDRKTAEAVLDQPIPEQIEIDGESAYEQPRCPRCGSLDIHYQGIHERAGLASILALGVPIPIPKRAWICKSCDASGVKYRNPRRAEFNGAYDDDSSGGQDPR